MADSKVTRTKTGALMVQGDAATPTGYVVFKGSDGFDRAIWVDTNGKLRIADIDAIESASHNPDSDGVVVGGQS